MDLYISDNPKHKEIKVAVNSYIKEDTICCINKEVKKSPDKIVKVKINDHKIFGKALWTGCINGVNVLGLELDIPGESGTDGSFCGVNLFQCIKGKGYLYLWSFVDEAQRIEFIKDIYLKNNCDIRDIERIREDIEGRLVSVEGDPRLFGRVKFCVTIMKESLKAVKINDAYGDNLNARYRDFIKDKVFSKNVVGEESVIIVRSKYVKLFKEDLRFIRGSDIFIDPESIKVKEGCEFREIKKGDIVSYENRGERCYGRIERVELWNDVRCVSVVNTMKVREQDDEEEKYIKEDKVTKVSKSLEYLQDPIIDPNSIVTFKEIKDEDLSVGDEVEFKLKMNLLKFTGNIVMIIEANDVPSAIVELDISSTDDFPSHFISFNEFFDKVNLLMPLNTVIVLLKKIKKLNGEEKCLNFIFEFIKNKEVGVNILVELLSKSDTRFVKNLIKEWNHPINLECYPDLLPKLINDGEYDIISTLFNHFVFSEENNFHILKIIKYFLFKKDFSLFNAACKKCINVNVIMDSGETFLTNVIKESDDEDIICRVIGTNIFDINKTNQDGESPLMLVCRKLMLSCVRLLVSNRVNISYQNNIVLDIVMDQENNETNVTQLSKIIQITKELTKKVRLETNVCSICENEPRNCVLNCGHTFCKTCAEKVIDCFLCRKQIINRIQFYE